MGRDGDGVLWGCCGGAGKSDTDEPAGLCNRVVVAPSEKVMRSGDGENALAGGLRSPVSVGGGTDDGTSDGEPGVGRCENRVARSSTSAGERG